MQHPIDDTIGLVLLIALCYAIALAFTLAILAMRGHDWRQLSWRLRLLVVIPAPLVASLLAGDEIIRAIRQEATHTSWDGVAALFNGSSRRLP